MWCYYAYGMGHASGMGVGVYALLGHHISLTLMWCYYAYGVGHASGMGGLDSCRRQVPTQGVSIST